MGAVRTTLAVLAIAAVTAVMLMPVPGVRAGTTVRALPGGPLVGGCDPARPAVAFRQGGTALDPQPRDRPIPCAVDIGPATESATVGVTRKGTVVAGTRLRDDHPSAPFNLLGPALVSVSSNNGAAWRTTQVGASEHQLFVPPWLHVDPRTSRIWFASALPTLCGTKLSWSDDEGRSWRTNPWIGCPGMGSLRVMEGPAPAGGDRPTGYPHVVYVCSNAIDFATSIVWCYRSLDGGKSFTFTGGHPDPEAPEGCGTRHLARPGTVSPDGKLVFPVYACGEISVAVSDDEGRTWRWHRVASGDAQELHHTSLAADDRGNLYLAWLAGPPPSGSPPAYGEDAVQGSGTPVIAISRDGGRTWSKPKAIAAPGIDVARRIAITARRTGQVAVSYLGSTDDGATYSGYVTYSNDMLAATPVLWAAPVNDPARPLMYGSVRESFGDRLFALNNAFGPDGTPWAAFHCVQPAPCSSGRSAVIGHLVLKRGRS